MTAKTKIAEIRLFNEIDKGITIDNVTVNIIDPYIWEVTIKGPSSFTSINDTYIFKIYIPKIYPFHPPRVVVSEKTPIKHHDVFENIVILPILIDMLSLIHI